MSMATPASRTGLAPGGDVLRQVTVAISAVLAVVGLVIGSGTFGGTPIPEASDGALAADATLVAPGGPAFSIWGVIYAGLVALAVWQALPRQREDARQRRTGWLVAASMLLNAAWILSIQAGWLVLSLPIILVLLGVLAAVFVRLRDLPAGSTVEGVVVDGTIGLYLGWVSVASVANVAAVLAAAGASPVLLGDEGWAVVAVVVAVLLGLATILRGRGRLAPAVALSWGLAWVAVARTAGSLESVVTAVAAAAGAVVVLVTVLAVRTLRGT